MPIKFVVTAIAVSVLFTACATMQEKQIHETPPSEKEVLQESPILKAKKNRLTGLKRKVAIGRFSNETRYGQSFFLDKNNDKIGKQAMDILSAKLFQSGRFIMLERADISKIEDELAIGSSKKLDNAADFLILGSITELGRKETSQVGIFSRVKKQETFAKVHIRIVDVSNGKIIYSEEGKGTAYSEAGTIFGVGEKASYNGQLNDKAIDAAISDLTSNIIENMLDKPWKGYILSYQDNSFITSGGKSQNIKVGDIFDIFKQGKQVKNPQTNMMISLPSKKIGSITITATIGDTKDTEVSLATLSNGDMEKYIASNDFTDLYIQLGDEK